MAVNEQANGSGSLLVNMVEHGLRWKDSYPGVWTAIVDMFGKPMIAYAVEVSDNQGRWVNANPASHDAELFFRRYLEATGHDQVSEPIYMAGKPHIVFVV